MRASDFLLLCAIHFDAKARLPHLIWRRADPVWLEFLAMTLPPVDVYDEATVRETRVMRFLLAAEIARSEGR